MQEEWAEKYRPSSLAEIVGNDNAIRVLKRWAQSWDSGAPRFKAIVLRGEPGTGKTSAALALARDMGWDCIEMNASDHRNAASIQSVAGLGSTTQTFSLAGEFLTTVKGMRKLIILDEADNLFGRQDYGGAKAIVETVRESCQPIVLIVNDYYELSRKAPAVKMLAEKAVFKRLSPREVVTVLERIVRKEGVETSHQVMERIARNAAGDLRAAINDLQMMFEGRERVDLADSDVIGNRNQLVEIDEALRAMFGARTVRSARDATFDIDQTPDDLVKWVEENAPLEMQDPSDLAAAFDAISKSDIYLGRTRRLQQYSLWAYAKELMTGGVAVSRRHGLRPHVAEYRFPSHFIVSSRARGPRNARRAVAAKLAEHFHTSPRCFEQSTLPYLSALLDRDEELLVEFARRFDLDESDIGLLLGVPPTSSRVGSVLKRLGGSDAASTAGGSRRKGSRQHKGLSEF